MPPCILRSSIGRQTSKSEAKREGRLAAFSHGLAIYNIIYRGMAIELSPPRTKVSVCIAAGGFSPSSKLLFDAQGTLERRRRRIWEMSSYLHCSIIGTCLTTTELRQILSKVELAGAHKETDHALH